MQASKPLRVALYGNYGHQLHHHLAHHARARVTAVCACDNAMLAKVLPDFATVKKYATLGELLADPEVDLVSMCAPRRLDQGQEILAALRAGKHVYAEKPAAMSEAELDAIMALSRECKLSFHEMAGTTFERPYLAMREVVASGQLGTITQILVQKSYPYHAGRPQDETLDSGLLMQVGIHAVRMVEHITKIPITQIQAWETTLGNPIPKGELRMASTLVCQLENGGLATIIANYLNQPGLGTWGHEELRIFGTKGLVESIRGGQSTAVLIGSSPPRPLAMGTPDQNYFDFMLAEILDAQPMPMTLAEELHPTRMVVRAKQNVTRVLEKS
jgi:predicted dehydrogenase